MKLPALAPALLLAACAHPPQLEPASATDPAAPNPTELNERASRAHRQGEYGQAYRLWNEAYAIEPLPATAVNIATEAALLGQTDNAFEWLHTAVDHGFTAVGWLRDPDLASLRGDPRWGRLPQRIRPHAEARNLRLELGSGLPRTTPEKAGLDPGALATLLKEVEASRTTGLVLLRDGKLVGEWYFGNWSRPVEVMSVTKSVLALAVGFLLEDGKLKSLDEPLWHFFPELRQGLKERLTVRHLLTHTSGIQALKDTSDVYRASDFVRLALAADLETEPGARFQYNNKGANLLAGVVEKASGQRADAYLADKLFTPLGIRDVQWTHDRAGNPHGMSGLQLHPVDLAKVGQLVLDTGRWAGKSLLPTTFIEEATRRPATRHTSEHGYLWWLTWEKMTRTLPLGASRALAQRNANPEWVKAAKAIEGKALSFDDFWNQLAAVNDKDAFVAELEKAGSAVERDASGLRSIEARGERGQYLVIFPHSRLVAARLAEVDEEEQPLPAFGALVERLVTKN